eukprot:TRINITY_DN793_c0_g1_i1.p1 TRINITY_DN793_c0_g1~~TRINITY_DN793_c0_g1_i1.p1  ORF type:complete len:155 (-),score=91.02 TRINITY_DN793_c0_g1_i1:123-563(-)
MAAVPPLDIDMKRKEEDEEVSDDESEEESSEEESSEEETLSARGLKSPISKLNLNMGTRSSYDDESNIFKDITLKFRLSDGSVKETLSKTGETFFIIKKRLQTDFAIDFQSKLFFNGKQLVDPLAIADYPELIAAGSPVIDVQPVS